MEERDSLRRLDGERRGSLLVVTVLCVAIMTLWLLSISLANSRAEDSIQAEAAQMAAQYAAESGLLRADFGSPFLNLDKLDSEVWFSGTLGDSDALYTVTCDKSDPKSLLVVSTGKVTGEFGKTYTASIKARLSKGADGKYTIVTRAGG